MGPITNLVSVVSANIATLGVTLTDGAVLLGEEFVHQDSTPPRVVMIPRNEKWSDRNAAAQTRIASLKKPLFTRHVTFETHLWGADFDTSEELLNLFVIAIHAAAAGIVQIDRGAWNTGTELGKFGREYVCEVSVEIPVTDTPVDYAAGGTVAPVIEPTINSGG